GFTLAYGLFQLIHGPLADRIGRLPAVTAALILAALACAACASAQSLEALAVFRFLTGMTAGAIIPLSFTFVGDNIPYHERQTLLGRFIAGGLLGQTCGPLLGGIFSDHFGWRATFLVPAAGFVVIGLTLLPVAWAHAATVSRTPSKLSPLQSYLSLLRLHRVRLVVLAVGIEGFAFFGAFGYLGAFLKHEFGLSYSAVGALLAGFALGGIVYSMLVKVLLRRFGQRGLVGAGGIVLLLGFSTLAMAPAWQACAPVIVALGLGYYMLHNTLQTRATEMAPQARAAAVSAFAFSFFMGQALGVSALGLAIEYAGYRPVLALSGVTLAALSAWFRARLGALDDTGESV
ncbi:MAG TPA: MFS transporter, partial [Burkholderiales bacterium]|nr:MFS transporter [Burkholderiales bacterium]